MAEHVRRLAQRLPNAQVESNGAVARALMDVGGQPERVGEVLGADFVIMGRTAMRANEAEVTVSIWDGASRATRWSQTYAYPTLSLQAIEDSVVAKLATVLGSQARIARTAAEASPGYEEIARGDYFLSRPDGRSADSARAAYERAIAADAKSALAKVRLARSYAALLARTGRGGRLSAEAAVREGLALTDAAARMDAKLAEAWTVRAMLLRYRDPELFGGVLAAHARAATLAPADADVHHEFGQSLLLLGNDRAALEHFRRALAQDPSRAATLRTYAELEMMGRRVAASCALVNASIASDPYDAYAYALRAQVRLQLGEFRDAYADAEIAARLSGEPWGNALAVLVVAGARDVERARRETKQLANVRLRPNETYGVREARYLAGALAAVGDRDGALDALSRARPRGVELRAALRDPALDPLRRDPRFGQVARSASEFPRESPALGARSQSAPAGS